MMKNLLDFVMRCHNQPNIKSQPSLTPKIRIRGIKYHTHWCPVSLTPLSLEGDGTSTAHLEQKLQNL